MASPPRERGELRSALADLARQSWCHPLTGEPVQFAASTIERWYYRARSAPRDPVGALRNRVRQDVGTHASLSPLLRQAVQRQHDDHPSWSVQLHYDNLEQLVLREPTIGSLPSYATLLRYMKRQGLVRRQRLPRHPTAGQLLARERLERREVRSYETEYVHSLWHLDYHEASRKVLAREGRWIRPQLLGVLDDHSRLACHVQWYRSECAESTAHGLAQAIQKRGLPRALMTDNGGALLADEIVNGLARLGIVHATTLPYSAYQNAKQEHFWMNVENRLLAMLENEEELSLETLNDLTQVWVEGDYNQRLHRELGTSPLRRYLDAPDVGREAPDSETLRRAFRREVRRTQRKSDGTVSLEGVRFELPSRYRQLERLTLRYARWDLRSVELVDPHTGDP
ncbi:MAG: DDE-type integrase/transposase/recombinase, partial [Gammaproteobacteria bacterium]|nr:DDE-type integrase/transposase/recombinase [Gammaproteobacteria bacterium]